MTFYSTMIGNSSQHILSFEIQGMINKKMDIPTLKRLKLRLPKIKWTISISNFNKSVLEVKSIVGRHL